LPARLRASEMMEFGVGVMETILTSGIPLEKLAVMAGKAVSGAFKSGARTVQSIRTRLGLGEAALNKIANPKSIADHAKYVAELRQAQQSFYMDELKSNGIKFSPDDIIDIQRMPDGRLAFLETGNPKKGLVHILSGHQADFERVGISSDQIPDALMSAVTRGKVIGGDSGRTIYEYMFNDTRHRAAISVSSNGFIVGAHPLSRLPPY